MDISRGFLADFFYAGRGGRLASPASLRVLGNGDCGKSELGRAEETSWVAVALMLIVDVGKSTYLALCSLHTGAKAESLLLPGSLF